jgi:hypothetical protein
MTEIRIIPNIPALQIQLKNEKILCIADLHLGFEKELEKSGIKIPSQTQNLLNSIQRLIKNLSPSRLIILGDVKHEIATIRYQETTRIYDFLLSLSEEVQVEIIPGNHDGQLKAITPPQVKIYSPRGVILKEDEKTIGLIHGHAWPDAKLLGSNSLIMAHTHPLIQLTTGTGFKITQPIWIKATWDRNCVAKAYLKYKKIKASRDPIQQFERLFGVIIPMTKIIIMPAYNKMLGGIPINTTQQLLGPLFKSNCIKPSNTEIYLLDGTYLGKLDSLRRKEFL